MGILQWCLLGVSIVFLSWCIYLNCAIRRMYGVRMGLRLTVLSGLCTLRDLGRLLVGLVYYSAVLAVLGIGMLLCGTLYVVIVILSHLPLTDLLGF